MMIAGMGRTMLLLILVSFSSSFLLLVRAEAAAHPLLFASGTTRYHHRRHPSASRLAIVRALVPPTAANSLLAPAAADYGSRNEDPVTSANRHRATSLPSSCPVAASSRRSEQRERNAPVDNGSKLKTRALAAIMGIALMLDPSTPCHASSANVVGKCSGSAMACVDPFAEPAARSSTTVAAVDAEHALLEKLLRCVCRVMGLVCAWFHVWHFRLFPRHFCADRPCDSRCVA